MKRYFILPIASLTRAILWAASEDSPATTIYTPAGEILLKMPEERAARLMLPGGMTLDELHTSGVLEHAIAFDALSPEQQAALAQYLDIDPRRDRESEDDPWLG